VREPGCTGARCQLAPRLPTGASVKLPRQVAVAALAVGSLLAGCSPADAEPLPWRIIEPWFGQLPGPTETPLPSPTLDLLSRLLPPTPQPGDPVVTPTPDPARPQPTVRTETEWYVVAPGDSLGAIAGRFGVGPSQIISVNALVNPDVLSIGQLLEVPPPIVQPQGPSFKVLPDSALVYGPASILFDLSGFSGTWSSHLNGYSETADGVELSGPGIVLQVAQQYSVDPRLLLAILELQGGWVRSTNVTGVARTYPVGHVAPGYEGLFSQLSWAADQLNLGYYRWKAGWAGPFVFGDGRVVPAGSGINAATAGVGQLFSQLVGVEPWRDRMSEGGFAALYGELFGDPFLTAIEPLVPASPETPPMQLPFESGTTWSFTGGPHAAWGSGAAWAAVDFAPPGFALGCVWSDAWVTAIADGPIVRARNGEVVQDLDGDGNEQTGWVVLYMHIDSIDRVLPGDQLRAGDRIGHPSCEGGVSNGTHVHLARRYNGEWIAADGSLPFDLDGWISAGLGPEYDGTMTRGGVRLEACGCRNDQNQIAR
jgi:murein DD-endopeptidase MepM/ murein hydrolase activator NlpD